jgi:uncharacterized protein (TIGR00645 family)
LSRIATIKKAGVMISGVIEKLIFWSRWILSPLYLGLIGILFILAYRFITDFVAIFGLLAKDTEHNVFVLDILALLDLVLLGNLILIVLFAGYENFVSKIEAAQGSVDRPYWMGTVDFSGLKIKLIGSLVAISVIELLKDFITLGAHPEAEVGQGTIWRIIIHLTFVLSGVLFAAMDWISGIRPPKTIKKHGDSSSSASTGH